MMIVGTNLYSLFDQFVFTICVFLKRHMLYVVREAIEVGQNLELEIQK